MKLFVAAALLVMPLIATASDLTFRVLRGDKTNIPDGDFYAVRAEWLPDGSLEVRAWTTETPDSSVIDYPASLDIVGEETIYLTYREVQAQHEPQDEDAPVVFCESAVELVFTV